MRFPSKNGKRIFLLNVARGDVLERIRDSLEDDDGVAPRKPEGGVRPLSSNPSPESHEE